MDYYDQISEGYGELHEDEQLRKAMIIAEQIRPRQDELLLDVGCGPATYISLFSCIKVGIDPSKELLRKAIEAEEGKEDCFFIQARAEALPFRDMSFDYVISVTAVHNFTDVKKGLSEIRRVAKGKVVLSVLKRSSKFGQIEKLIEELFEIKKIILEDKDAVFLLEPKK